ncbi:adenylate cyclase [Nocardioides sp. ChNu-153]|uniref:hypothetical protein n=1 Tax=Nocardioides sp. ChNu-153 TaxID=2779364 RepID=UPI002652CB74|nr:hypothetical protein [Nocardioides sp. ChNu-153]MDN7121486.1 adenylate cyclase [Nocardioides sp. ChNu-153]
MSDTKTLLRQVEAATTATDLFGPPSADAGARRRARRTFRVLAFHLHPDRLATAAPGVDRARAAAAFAKATELHEAWGREADGDTTDALQGRRGTYAAGPLLARGTVANVHAVPGQDAVVKIARRPASSRFVRNERDALQALRTFTDQPGNGWLAPYFPRLLDTATVGSPTERREANVLGSLGRADGFYSLAQVQQAAPEGLDGRDWAWMQRRLLRALAGAHAAGLVHGALLPENVLIHPREHGVVLAGWSFATRPGRPAEGRVASQAAAYPPEASTGVLTPASDLFMLGALGLALLRPEERAQRRFAEGCMQAAPAMRPRAADLLEEYDDLLDRLYGARRFRPFAVAV